MKIDREIMMLEKTLAKSDFIHARSIIERNIHKFSSPTYRRQLSIEALTLMNSVILINSSENKEVYSRETLLIIQYINSLARNGRLQELKRYSLLQAKLLSNPKIYSSLCLDAKALIPPPELEKELCATIY